MQENISVKGFGLALERVRASKGLSQRGLAAISGITQATIAQIESGKANPTVKTLDALAKALNVYLRISLEPGDRA